MSKRAGYTMEFLWQRIRPQLPKKKDQMNPSASRYTTLGGTKVFLEIGKTLERGAKFCFEPVLSPPELLTLVKKVAEEVDEGDRPRCITELVDVLEPSKKQGDVGQITTLVDFMVDQGPRVMLSDKEGLFCCYRRACLTKKQTRL